MRLLLPVLLSVIVTLGAIKPSCFNCHCSTLTLDNNLRCNEAILNKSTTYFTLRTTNVTALYGSDIMLAAVMKERAEHCWCTDSHLEWNLQNVELWNDTKLITVTLQNVSAVATGHYWAVLEHDQLYYFSDPIYLNATGRIVPVPTPPLDADPKMSALIVGLLVVIILVCGVFIYCWKMVKLKRRERKMALYKNMEQVQQQYPGPNFRQFPVDEYYSELQQMSSIIDHMTEQSAKEEEEGDTPEEDNTESSIVENSKQTATVVPTVSTVLPIVKARSVPEYYEMPQITDDRFSNQRSWYKSLDVEINSQSLLKDPERAGREAEKKRQKEEKKQSMSNITPGLLGSGMVCSGLMGNSAVSHTAQALALEDMKKYLDTITSMKECGYGRSLPTPMAAGRRPTVMTLFGNPSPGNTISKTATIHTTRPVPRQRAQSLFQGMEESSGSRVTFDDKVHSSDNMLIEKKKKKRKSSSKLTKTPHKSSLKPKPEKSDEQAPEKKSDDSTSISSESDVQLAVPSLQLTPCSPPGSPSISTPAPAKSSGSRFTVVTVAAEPPNQNRDLGKTQGSIDPLLSSAEWRDGGRRRSRSRMDTLTVPGPGGQPNQNTLGTVPTGASIVDIDGYWST